MPTPEEQVQAKVEANRTAQGNAQGGESTNDEGQARDAQGRFTSQDANEEERAEGPTEEQTSDDDLPTEEETTGDGDDDEGGEPDESLSLEVVQEGKAPTYGHDGRFVGGKLFGKYETLDDQIIGHANALKRIGQLEADLAESKRGGISDGSVSGPLGGLYVPDMANLTPEQLTKIVQREMSSEELSVDERIQAEENPVAFAAKHAVRVNQILERIKRHSEQWRDSTRMAYPKVFDKAHGTGAQVLDDYNHGKVGPAEFMMILGLGEMARRNVPSGEEQITRLKPSKPKGRSPVSEASKGKQPKPKEDPRSVQKKKLEEMMTAAYG